MEEKKINREDTESPIELSTLSQFQSFLENLITKFTEFETLLINLEKTISSSSKKTASQDISEEHLMRIIQVIYNSVEKKTRDFILISSLTNKIKEYLPWSTKKIHHELYKLFTEYRVELHGSFLARAEMALSYIEQRESSKKLLDRSIQGKNRSTIVELTSYKFFKELKNHLGYDFFTDVKHEPQLGPSNKKLDVFLEFFGKEGLESVKNVGIEIKMFRKGKEITKKDKKTYIHLEEKAVDYLIWITNIPLDLNYRYKISPELHPNPSQTSTLDNLELAYIAFMLFFEEIFESGPTFEHAEFILNKIDLSPITLKEKLPTLPKLTKFPKIPQPKITDITSFGGPSLKTSAKSVEGVTTDTLDKKKKLLYSVEIGLEQIIPAIEKYIDEKSKDVSRIIRAHTIKSIKESLGLATSDNKWDEEIWARAIEIGKNAGYRTTTKTIFF